MREIVFRGKFEFNGNALYPKNYCWVYGFYIEIEGEPWIKNGRSTKIVNPKSVGQFTGLSDRKGMKIWDGDIVRVKSLIFSEYVTLQVCIHHDNYPGTIMVYSEDNHCALFDVIDDAEVIGNIYENPELIGE